MVIDQEILHLPNEVPSTEKHAEMHGLHCVKEVKEWYVKVVEAFSDPEETEGVEEYKGWMNCSIYTLVRLWHSMDDAIIWCISSVTRRTGLSHLKLALEMIAAEWGNMYILSLINHPRECTRWV